MSVGALLGVGGLYWYLREDEKEQTTIDPNVLDYELLRSEIRSILYHESFDDGCCAPLLLRLAFNQCATYSKYDGLGGMNGASLRFDPERSYPHNRGLDRAMKLLESIKRKYPKISYSDLWVLASYVAIEEMGGPYIEFRGGRKDCKPPTENNLGLALEEQRFPEWDAGGTRLLDWFDRMGLSDREGTCLMGGHSCGRLHAANSGIEGTWLDAQILTNDYFKNIVFLPYLYERRGREHYYDPAHPEVVLLPIEGSFKYCARVMRWAEFYAYADLHVWLEDFGAVWKKVTENGCLLDDDDPDAPLPSIETATFLGLSSPKTQQEIEALSLLNTDNQEKKSPPPKLK
ncbi:Peroxidase family protein [Reticulomyxa filosa]|uniref:Peroxidase family protein n=1 Tax=Reticulomyxa filosa TaxID=46433 RepID=X6NMJ5_RETFI|nr:Peroxidase family protein [Reticulomyxa filosa]|eukprot:ETO27475.1 Peroxidase family protein [Reticulomyxa filosa]